MTKFCTATFGEPLNAESQRLVADVRARLTQPIRPEFDTDFNIYRFLLNAERNHKHSRKEVVESAARALNAHLRLRQCLRLDDIEDVPFEKNPIFARRFLPFGKIDEHTDRHNRLLWFIEYATISVEYIAHGMRSSEACRYQFYQFEHMLRRVNEQEKATQGFSSLRHIIDMNNYEINPFTMLFVSSGTLSYYSQLFHYENYPELVYPIELVNIAKWIHVPYKLIKAMMPAGFADRFRLHDDHFLQSLSAEIDIDDIPTTLGGKNVDRKCIPAQKLAPADYWKPPSERILAALQPLHVSARRTKTFSVEVADVPKVLSWYFATDNDIYFGVFFEPASTAADKAERKEVDVDTYEMVYPWLKLTAKLVHEFDALHCTRAGTYHVVFSNKHSWMKGRTIELMVQVSDAAGTTRRTFDGAAEPLADSALHIVEQLQLQPHPTS